MARQIPVSTVTIATLLCSLLLGGCASAPQLRVDDTKHSLLYDSSRNRAIPLVVYFNQFPEKCTMQHLCPVALISPDAGVSDQAYSFIAKTLNSLNFLVVSLQQNLPTDPPLPTQGNLYTLRQDTWRQGADNIRYVRTVLQGQYTMFDWDHMVLIGHGNGGDTALWFTKANPGQVRAVVTLDNLLEPLLRSDTPRQLSLRAVDDKPAPGVLPDAAEQKRYGIQVVTLADAHHADMRDSGPAPVKETIRQQLLKFFQP